MPDIKFEIIKKIGVLSKTDKGWAKELNLISWNDREPKYDIREWSPNGQTTNAHPLTNHSFCLIYKFT